MSRTTIAVLVGIVWPLASVGWAWAMGQTVRRRPAPEADAYLVPMAPVWPCRGCAECSPDDRP